MEIDRTERQGLEEALLHSQKLKAVGQLTGGLAHDFNNLLAVIIGSLELVSPDSPDAPRITRALKAAERGALLTQRLLAFSRKQSLHPHSVELKTLLENLSELMRHSLPATLTLEIEAQSARLGRVDRRQPTGERDHQPGDERPRCDGRADRDDQNPHLEPAGYAQ
ncbi:Blue-light-activated protein [Citrobacter koseri]|uniref:histidine kinase n=1 Tax=Citrobacter koseri TaxID=545 RepID=A0A2X2VAG3_CITKO|nr:Blue-light-activated protein [Citrobacter koseri]